MRFCQAHWDELLKELVDRDLARFTNRHELRSAPSTPLDRDDPERWDPLVSAFFSLIENLMNTGDGPAILKQEGCALCDVTDRCACGLGEDCGYRKWIALAADGELQRGRRLGLVAPIQ